MKKSLFFLFLIFSTSALSQVKVTLYYTKGWQLTKKDSARYIRTAIYDTLNYNFNGPVEDKYATGKIQMTGNYRSGSKEGPFIFYYENGRVESAGNFESNSRSGVWKYFYRDGKPRMEVDFAPVFGNEPDIHYLNDSSGRRLLLDGTGKWLEVVELANGSRMTITGEYRNNEKHGKWEVKTTPGKNVVIERYNKGRFVDGYVRVGGVAATSFNPQDYSFLLPEKIHLTESFAAQSNIDFRTYPQLKLLLHGENPVVNYIWDEGEPVYLQPEVSAEPPGGFEKMYVVLSSSMQYPIEAQVQGITGKVYMQFVVNADGRMSRFKVVKGVGGGCDEEVMRVFLEYSYKNKFTPATQYGRKVKQLILMSPAFEMEVQEER